MNVPYSRAWNLPVYASESIDGSQAIRFGRAISTGDAPTREYLLITKPVADLPILRQVLDGGCGGTVAATTGTIDHIPVVRHGVGGAKGCSLGYAFDRGLRSFFLYRIADLGDPMPDIDDEMRTVVLSIHEP
ncbi:MAG: hypothetical protein WCK01_00480 [Candidatus Uhrbacteria bacterium]